MAAARSASSSPRSRLTSAAALRYGRSAHCELRATGVTSHGLEGISFTMHYRGDALRAASPMPGEHSVYACLAAKESAETGRFVNVRQVREV